VQNDKVTIYPGHAICTRWEELPLPPGQYGRRFGASFTVMSPHEGARSRQSLSDKVFDTARNAAADALARAKHSIDRSSKRGWTRSRGAPGCTDAVRCRAFGFAGPICKLTRSLRNRAEIRGRAAGASASTRVLTKIFTCSAVAAGSVVGFDRAV
jgi:hypothetical protein